MGASILHRIQGATRPTNENTPPIDRNCFALVIPQFGIWEGGVKRSHKRVLFAGNSIGVMHVEKSDGSTGTPQKKTVLLAYFERRR